MQVKQEGEWLTVMRVTGPHHNLLSLRLEQSGGSALQMPLIEVVDEGPVSGGIAEADVLEEVRIGAAAANERLGTSYRVRGIRFFRGDTPPIKIYRMLAERLVHAAAEEEGATSRLRAAG
jgi:hypothetical protein